MFKRNSGANPQALMAAQHELDVMQNAFEQRTFAATVGGVTVVLSGKKVMTQVSVSDGGDTAPLADIQAAYDQVVAIMEHERNLLLVQLRNTIQKRFRADIKGMVPEIAAAVAYMENRQAAS